MQTILQALFITAVGMGLVFMAIIVLWLLMLLLTLLPHKAPQPGHTAMPTTEDPARLAAAVAVAIALAEQSQSNARPLPEPPTTLVSAWQLGMRTRQMYEKGGHS